jgi:Xaa-Pro aminopeptidase
MNENNIDIYILSSSDPHIGEYVPEHWMVIKWLTGFSGSFARAVITRTFAGLWTDSRYYIQASRQIEGSDFVLVKPDLSGYMDYIEWLSVNINSGEKIGFDGRIISIKEFRRIIMNLEHHNVVFNSNCDLISELWDNRPLTPSSVAFDHPISYCGKGRLEKVAEVRERMKKINVKYHILTSPDDIMWLLNIRGNDLKYSPILLSFAVVGEEQVLLFINEDKIPFKMASEFDSLGIVILPYEEVSSIISSLQPDSVVLLNPAFTSVEIFNSISKETEIIEDITIPAHLKSLKNSSEIENIRNVMIKDGVAVTRFFYFLEEVSELKNVSELSLTKKLEEFRSEQENFLGPSFNSIIAFNGSGALPHYSATEESNTNICNNGILLADSGGQYLDGTTDITRTIAIGEPSEKQIRDFTLVLKGMIDLANAKFPEGTYGYQLDLLARKALWSNGINYGHGTGHGVGFCLNVHEGPQNISVTSNSDSKVAIKQGMLISDEPALYRENEYGIRTENLLLCCEDIITEYGKFLKFDTLSLCYIDQNLIDFVLLGRENTEWLNNYHKKVFDKLSPHLSLKEKNWLKKKTREHSY